MLGELFTAVLRSGRADFNAKFALARRQYPELDGDAFTRFLETSIEPWVRATPEDRVAGVVMAGYEVGLELVGQRVAGPGAFRPEVDDAIQRVLPAVAAIIAAEPMRAIASVANAAHQIASTPGARASEWVAAMERLGPRAGDLEQLLALGQVAAWRAGMAHFRKSALAVADALPAPLALAAVGARDEDGWSGVRARLAEDEWYVPGGDAPALRVALGAGAFRGFGGLFVEPPRLAISNGSLLAESGGDAWLLFADAFGATFHRATADEIRGARTQDALPAGIRVDGATLVHGRNKVLLPTVGTITSFASSPTSVALTSSLSHAVVLVALGAAS